MMLKLLDLRETGVDKPCYLCKAEATRRTFSLHLSKHFDLERRHVASINSLDLEAIESRFLLSGSGDGSIAIHDLHYSSIVPKHTFPCVSSIDQSNPYKHKYSVETVQWYPLDTGMFLSSGMDKIIKVWDTNNLTVATQFDISNRIYCHEMSSTLFLIAIGNESDKVQLIDLRSGSGTHKLSGHQRKSILSVRWSPRNEYQLVSAGRDSRILVWDVRKAKGCSMMLDQHNGDTSALPNSVNTAHDGLVNGITFLPDGLHLLSFGTDDNLRLWNTTTGSNMMVNYGRIPNDIQTCLKFAVSQGTSSTAVFVPSEGDVDVFNVFTGMRVGVLQGHFTQVNCCVFKSDMQELLSGGKDRNILYWTPDTETVQAYDDHVTNAPGNKLKESDSSNNRNFTSRIGASDAWSDED